MYTFNIDGREFVLKPITARDISSSINRRCAVTATCRSVIFELARCTAMKKRGACMACFACADLRRMTRISSACLRSCAPKYKGIIDFVFATMKAFGFNNVGIELSTRPEKSIGSDEDWKLATDALEGALKEKGLSYASNVGEGAFYGPKIDIKLKTRLTVDGSARQSSATSRFPKGLT